MKNGATVKRFEEEFAAYVGGRFAIALNSGTSTLHTALAALGIGPGDSVAVPPLTMSATTIAVLHAGATPLFVDVDPQTWLMQRTAKWPLGIHVSLYGLCAPETWVIDDAAQTLRQHSGCAFTSYSFQASKILALGEGGMLVTNDESLATRAREFSSLGYRMRADQPRIDPAALKSPTFDRHYSLGWNYRMNDLTAAEGLRMFARFDGMPTRWTTCIADDLLDARRVAAALYADEIDNSDCGWLTPQYVSEGWRHDMWTYAVACDSPDRALRLADAVVKHGGERPYPAWRLTYDEPAFEHLATNQAIDTDTHFAHRILDEMIKGRRRVEPLPRVVRNLCPVAESLQPRLLQFQTNDLASAERNAGALRKAIEEMNS